MSSSTVVNNTVVSKHLEVHVSLTLSNCLVNVLCVMSNYESSCLHVLCFVVLCCFRTVCVACALLFVMCCSLCGQGAVALKRCVFFYWKWPLHVGRGAVAHLCILVACCLARVWRLFSSQVLFPSCRSLLAAIAAARN